MWNAAQQAPWRMSPWQTQGMPSGTPLSQPPMLPMTSPQQSYLPAGTSQGLQGFQPAQPGGGFYPGILGGGQQQQAPQQAPAASPNLWQYGGQTYANRRAARNAAMVSPNEGFGPPSLMGPSPWTPDITSPYQAINRIFQARQGVPWWQGAGQ